jgi:hypothetical protein
MRIYSLAAPAQGLSPDLSLPKKNSKKFFGPPGTPSRPGHYAFVTAETPPPVQAAGDTIPKGLRASGAEAFFFVEQRFATRRGG